jgi:hypothetical protein
VVDADAANRRTVTNPDFGDVQLSSNLSFSPDGSRIAFTRNQGLWVAELDGGTEHRIAGSVTAVGAWLAMEPSRGVTRNSLAAAVTPVPFEGELPTLSDGQVDANGWPILACEPGTAIYRLRTRKVALCIPDGWSMRLDQEYTQDGFWGAFLEFESESGVGWAMRVLERERSGPYEGFFHGCDIQQAGSLLGVPAVVCAGTVDSPNGLGLTRPVPPGGLSPAWQAEMLAITPDYMVDVNAWHHTDLTDAEARMAEALEVAASARAGADLERVFRD